MFHANAECRASAFVRDAGGANRLIVTFRLGSAYPWRGGPRWGTLVGMQPFSEQVPTPAQTTTAMQLRFMAFDELVDLFHRLPAPAFEEMHGEYAATLLEQGSGSAFITAQVALNVKGRWLCKAFAPTASNDGHGYNTFMTPRGVKRSARMKTRIGPSKIPGDQNESFHLEYAPFNDFRRGGIGGAFVHTMFDELRKAAPGLYLGIGRVGFTEKQLAQLHPFLLEGPVADFAE